MSESEVKISESILLLILVQGVLLLSSKVESVRFEVESYNSKCIAEEIKKDVISVGKYLIVNLTQPHPLPDTHKLMARVTSTSGNSYHYSHNVTEGNFVFDAEEEGNYWACFFAPNHKPPITLTIDFEWKSGILAKDWTNVAKKGSVALMELELKKMFDIIQSIHYEMTYLRVREEAVRELNIATNSKMAWLSLLSLAICMTVAGLQFWHLKSFFVKKKLI